jgi:hypothetical protein
MDEVHKPCRSVCDTPSLEILRFYKPIPDNFIRAQVATYQSMVWGWRQATCRSAQRPNFQQGPSCMHRYWVCPQVFWNKQMNVTYWDHCRFWRRLPSSGMLHGVTLVRTDVLEERIACIIKVKITSELGTTLAVTSNWNRLRRNTDYMTLSLTRRFFPPCWWSDTFLRNVGPYKTHPASHPRRRHSSESSLWTSHILHTVVSVRYLPVWTLYYLFFNPISFAICTSTCSKLCQHLYNGM